MAFRKRLLAGETRALALLDRLETASDWGTPSVAGAGQGMAFSFAYESFVGTVVEASLANGRVRVHRATCVVDCGTVINPDYVKAQIEGGLIFGMGPALDNIINFEVDLAAEVSDEAQQLIELGDISHDGGAVALQHRDADV